VYSLGEGYSPVSRERRDRLKKVKDRLGGDRDGNLKEEKV
jgi:RecB family endonuclease NucS